MSEPKTNKRVTYKDTSLLVSNTEPSLAEAQEKEAMFNLVNFVETLIKMDRQRIEWLERNKGKTAEVQVKK